MKPLLIIGYQPGEAYALCVDEYRAMKIPLDLRALLALMRDISQAALILERDGPARREPPVH